MALLVHTKNRFRMLRNDEDWANFWLKPRPHKIIVPAENGRHQRFA